MVVIDKALETVGLKQKPKEEEVNLFAYDSDLDTNTFFDKLIWPEADVSKAASRKRVEATRKKVDLRGFRLAFNGLRGKQTPEDGFANIVRDESGEVHGIVYRLPTEVFNFLKGIEIDYQPLQVQITTENGTEVAWTFVAARTGENLKASDSQLELMYQGSAGFGFDLGYTREQPGPRTSTNSDNHEAHDKSKGKGVSTNGTDLREGV